jgi:gas vesicle protein
MKKKQIHHIEGNLLSRKKQYNYPGQLVINGDIEPGCQVSADTIEVNNVAQADIRVRSGMQVHEKVLDSSIVSGGYFEARIVERSTIRAESDICIQASLRQSDIYSNKCCLLVRCLVELSNIMACQCIDVHTIISSEETPCTLTIGLLCPDDQDLKIRSDYLSMERQKKQLNDNLEMVEKIIADTLQLKEKIKSIKPSIKQKIIQLKANKNYEAIKELDPFFKQLNERVESAFMNYQKAIENRQNLIKQIESFDQATLDETRKKYLLRKKDRLERSMQCHTDVVPYIKVRDSISEHTRIQGLHAYKRLQETVNDVRIQEVENKDIQQTSSIGRYEIKLF